MGYAPGLAFLGTVKLRVFCGLAQVLIHVSTVKINILYRNSPMEPTRNHRQRD